MNVNTPKLYPLELYPGLTIPLWLWPSDDDGDGDGVVVSPSIWLPARFLIWLNPFPAPSPRQQLSCLLSRFDDRRGKN